MLECLGSELQTVILRDELVNIIFKTVVDQTIIA